MSAPADRPAHGDVEADATGGWLRAVIDEAVPTGTLLTDAHLVALMTAHDVGTIWTRDRAFRRFPGVEVRDPFA